MTFRLWRCLVFLLILLEKIMGSGIPRSRFFPTMLRDTSASEHWSLTLQLTITTWGQSWKKCFFFHTRGSKHVSTIVGKKRDLGILDPIIFSGKIRFKVSLKFGEKIRKNTENLEKYSRKFGKKLWKNLEKYKWGPFFFFSLVGFTNFWWKI